MNKIFTIAFLLGFSLICNAQITEILANPIEVKRGFGFGLDFSICQEPKIDNYNYPPFSIDKPLHFDYLPNITYNFYNGSSLGLLIGFGNAKSDLYNDIHNQTEYFESKSTEIGLFYKYRLINRFHHRFSGYIQPIVRYRKVSQLTTIHEDNGQVGEFVTGGQDIESVDLNLRLTLGYEIVKRLELGIFVSNDIISKEQVKEKVAFIQPSDDWIFIKDYIFGGLTITYKLK
jgi:hypothetical protein